MESWRNNNNKKKQNSTWESFSNDCQHLNEQDFQFQLLKQFKLNKQKHASVEYTSINGANHFFKDHMDELRSSIASYMKPRVSTMEPIPVKLKRDRRRRQGVPGDE